MELVSSVQSQKVRGGLKRETEREREGTRERDREREREGERGDEVNECRERRRDTERSERGCKSHLTSVFHCLLTLRYTPGLL